LKYPGACGSFINTSELFTVQKATLSLRGDSGGVIVVDMIGSFFHEHTNLAEENSNYRAWRVCLSLFWKSIIDLETVFFKNLFESQPSFLR